MRLIKTFFCSTNPSLLKWKKNLFGGGRSVIQWSNNFYSIIKQSQDPSRRLTGCFTNQQRFLHSEPSDDSIESIDVGYESEYYELARQFLNPKHYGHGVFVIQPYVKWGREKRRNTTPKLQLLEAETLVKTMPDWQVIDSLVVSLQSFDKYKIFGKGNLEKLEKTIKSNPKITAVFLSINVLRPMQIMTLHKIFGVTVFDRYSVVIQIFRDHARTQEAKLQVALAELPYVWKQVVWSSEDSQGRINITERRRMILHAREKELKMSLNKLKEHRKLIRSFRTVKSIATVAVVGYTNAGKTCLIKALTDDESLVPENKLFATLDTTAHAGILPCGLKVLFMDTIGFIQDIPEGLFEPFIATFEDAIIADVIVHVYDTSHPDKEAQIQHVRETLNNIMSDLEITNKPIIEVANKCDVATKEESIPDDILPVSALKLTGVDLLRERIENELLIATGHKSMKIRVQLGSPAAAWLYKEATVIKSDPDPNNLQYTVMNVLITELKLMNFKKFISQ